MLDFKFVDDLLDVGNLSSHFLYGSTLRLRRNVTFQGHHAISYVVADIFLEPVLNQHGIKVLSMPESRSESIFLAVDASSAGRTPISFDTTSEPAMDLAIVSARALSSSDETLPVRVTTLLSRSWLTLTS